jgi:hypothetical protein
MEELAISNNADLVKYAMTRGLISSVQGEVTADSRQFHNRSAPVTRDSGKLYN